MSLSRELIRARRSEQAAEYWIGVDVGELRYQHCTACERAVFPARIICPYCSAMVFEWRVSNALGRLYSFTVIERGAVAAFREEQPYTVAIVELDEGFRMTSRVVGTDLGELTCDQRVKVVFDNEAGLPYVTPEGP